MKSLAAISSSEACVMPAALARSSVSALRPASEVSTLMPLSVSLLPTPAPIMPGAITATTGVMLFSGNSLLVGANPAAYGGRWQGSGGEMQLCETAACAPPFLLPHQQRRGADEHQHQQQCGRPACEPAHRANRDARERGQCKRLEREIDHGVVSPSRCAGTCCHRTQCGAAAQNRP